MSVFSYAFILLALTGCGFEPVFDPPFGTIQTYVWAYNHNDKALMKECGFSADLDKCFRTRIDVGVGEPRYEKVRDISVELLYKVWARPKATMRFTNERILMTVLFTSDSDPTYRVKVKLLLVKRRSTFTEFGEPTRWRLMPLEAANEQDAGDVPFE